MGCDPERDAACVTDELPAHAVELSAFDLDLTEVTQQQYAACVDAAACPVPDDTQTCYAKWDPVVLAEHPVVCVDHAAATAYCAWVGRALPTEAQWEAAARGPAAWLYPWGDVAPACELANYGPSAMDCVGATTPVGAYPSGASPFGALDLAGNVWEWTADWYGPSSYREGPFVDPVGAASGSARVLRGGGFTSPEAFLRATARDGARAPWKTARNVGFRCASSTGHP
jgi:serine/threonine-protein kinase